MAVDLKTEAGGYFSGLVSQANARECSIAFGSMRTRLFTPIPFRAFNRKGRMDRRKSSIPRLFSWSDHAWPGVPCEGQVIYEMHIGTFTLAGTWAGAIGELEALAEVGITLIEVMPVADFSGDFGWGYDGVNFFAPTRLYGSPDDFRRFVDRAHALGMGVILDVVYNHFGPDGNYLKQFAEEYFTDRYANEWGDAINFDGPESAPVREFFLTNAAYWIDEYHLDGLRLDATQQIFDAGEPHILAELGARVRSAAGQRSVYIVAENEPQEPRLVRPLDQGGYGLDALWNDDFHHAALVAMKGHSEAYCSDYLGKPQEFISAAKWGFLYQGQRWLPGKSNGRGLLPALDLHAGELRHVFGKPRSGRQHRSWAARSQTCQPRPVSRPDSPVAAGPGHADAVPGARIWLHASLPFLRRSWGRSGQACPCRAGEVSRAVSQPGR